VWQGLTDPALMKRYWRHQKAGPKTFHSDWTKAPPTRWRTTKSDWPWSAPSRWSSSPIRPVDWPTPGTRSPLSGPRSRPLQRRLSAVSAMFSTVGCWSKPFT